MSIKNKLRAISNPVAMISLLAGVAIMGLAHGVSAFAPAGASANSNGDPCLFSQQLQSSVAVRRQYLVKIEQYTGSTNADANSIEEMYGNVKQASYSTGDETDDGISGFFGVASKRADKVVGIDSMSAGCISCHDGVGASAVGVELRNRPFDRRSMVNSFNSDHPIGMKYDSYANAGRGYKAVLPGSNKMIFVNGRVGCLTCHDPLNPEKGHLVMSDRNSALCNTCHNK